MDDSLEQPTTKPSLLPSTETNNNDDDVLSSDEEDGGPDWTKMPSASFDRPVIPKRGEKDFEPNNAGGSALQQHMLDRMRMAMFNALNVPRSASSKSISYAIWIPHLARAHVTTARGTHFTNMGHSAPRPVACGTGDANANAGEKLQRRLELLPEEALYLVERGSMFCWKEDAPGVAPCVPGHADIAGTPMTVQQAYAEMIGKEALTLERYQVFAYLRRLGYVVTRARPPTSYYPAPASAPARMATSPPRHWLVGFWSRISTYFRAMFARSRDWWRPLRLKGWFCGNATYPSIYASLRLIPCGHGATLHKPAALSNSAEPGAVQSPYSIFYHVYKPSTPFRKTAPPAPDFSIVVINARTTSMPSLHEITALFDVLPETPLPPPRQRQPGQSINTQPATQSPAAPIPTQPPFHTRTWHWLFPTRGELNEPTAAPRRPHPFQALKFGKKNVIIAVVDSGTTSFFRFGQGVFDEWPMASGPPPKY